MAPSAILGIGLLQVATAFAIVAPYLYRPLPYDPADELVVPRQRRIDGVGTTLSGLAFSRFVERTDVFACIVGYPQLESIMRNEPIDFIGVHYGIDKRSAEEKILPLALERKIGVVAYFPFSVGTLFQRAGTTPLPEWAAEFDAKTWAQFFLKYVVSHPAVTVVRAGTIQATHMLENIGGGIGRLPDEAMRKRMAALIDSWPKTAPAGPPPGPIVAVPVAVLDRYVGEYKAASGFTATFRRDGDKLFVKPGNNPEIGLLARTETRFQDPRGPFFEFQVDAQGKVTGAVLEQQGAQGTQRTVLERK